MGSTAVNQSQYTIPVVAFLNNIVKRVAETTAWLNVILIGVILLQVVMRYGFSKGMVPLEELMWHLYAIAFMFGMAYSITTDSHIRVDIVHMSLSRKSQHIIEILGILLLLMPFLVILFHHSVDWAYEAWRVNESSANPTGLPYRWVIKSVVPISALLMFIAAFARLLQEALLLMHYGKEPEEVNPGRVAAMLGFFHKHADNNSKGESDHDA